MHDTHVLLGVLVTSLWTASTASAAPSPSRLRVRQDNGGDNSSNSLQPQIWIPLVVIAALFVVGTVVACCGRRIRRSTLLNWGNSAALAAGVSTGTASAGGAREVTADQLVGMQSGTPTTGPGSNRARRPRRTRRTPSQISTHSLPAYMKEPGDQEIVIVRGADDMEDDVPITVTMPPLDEHEDPDSSLDLSRPATAYSPVPHTGNNVPLLLSDEVDAQHHLSPDHLGMPSRASFDSSMSSMESNSQHYTDEAPPYETVILDDPPEAATTPAPITPLPAIPVEERSSTEQSGAGTNRRRSVFASIFNPRTSRLATPPVPVPVPRTATSPEPRSSTGHTREGSSGSIPASERDVRRSRVIRHHASQSGSGSMFSLLSRTRSNQNLNGAEALTSPSMISLNSISSPLTHTLVKTEFTYPRMGPTPDQIKLISSRESFARFGKPYGADAIAYAASASRNELEPPPGFEEIAGPSGSSPSPDGEEGRGSPSSGSSQEQEHTDSAPVDQASPSIEPLRSPRMLPEIDEVESPVTVAHTADLPSPTVPPSRGDTNMSVATASTSGPAAIDGLPVTTSPVEPVSPPALSPSPEPVQQQPSRSRSPQLRPSASSPALNAPPSAFKGVPATTPMSGTFPRAASRASSYMSYATAEESLHSPTAYESQMDLNDDAYESAVETPIVTAPPTPRMPARHVHEDTDTTITPHS